MKRLKSKKTLDRFANIFKATRTTDAERFRYCSRVLYTIDEKTKAVTGLLCQEEDGGYIYAEGTFKQIVLFSGSELVPFDS